MASDASESLTGYSIRRNNSCATSETDCGGTWGSFRRCCPGSTHCPRSTNGICCPTRQDCSHSLISNPHCADKTANLYYIEESRGFACCPDDMVGFHLKDSGYAGCAEDLENAGSNTQSAVLVTAAAASSSSATASSTDTATATTNTATSTPTNTTTSHESSHPTNTGAIAGGVVGGVAGVAILLGLVWLLLRRRKKHQQDNQRPTGPVREPDDHNAQLVGELPGSNGPTMRGVSELDGGKDPAPAELSSDTAVPVENPKYR